MSRVREGPDAAGEDSPYRGVPSRLRRTVMTAIAPITALDAEIEDATGSVGEVAAELETLARELRPLTAG
jgi:hypothetical protein